MTKRYAAKFLFVLVIYALISGLAGIGFSAFASSGTHVFRGAVAPKPKIQAVAADSQIADRAEPDTPAQSVPAASPAKAAASKKKTTTPAPDVVKKTAKTAPKQTDAAPKAPAVKAKKSAVDKTKSAKPAVKPGTSKDLLLNAQAALLINMSTGDVYYEHNPDKTIAPASITKLLTLYIIREALAQGRLSQATPIPVSAEAVKTGGSRMRLKRNEKVPLGELIKGISVVSANNACVAVAEYFGKGDPSKFVAQMNEKAKKIGMVNSRFKNPNGLPASGQLSTARDIAKLSVAYLRTFPESLKVHSMTSHTFHGATHRNANTLLRTYKGVDGLKTGFVCDAGYNITATAKRGKTRLVAVVLGAQNSAVRQRETARLLDYGFRRAADEEKLANKTSAAAKKPKA
ncbi:D-alanyl-D-alanine carboxypeptidase family protein [Desulfomicrobium baculatum]|uniref:Serine-type D-Ala-D-Ala carboxypeptidase n=1 Tax=Desulfomicrobium baculatum (strain DSM 4028 / VKM B-1378 / X) TaxID=525897 RepID=C7LPB9_DESBD|nr:D-alanyl-D-alanine carboxypeptidase family protein [Desulfomicrobium baculatum]ACU88962.1 Serine-type D-Ala-D-Ala carboxypeptidase [Desulfomicrobium baculatum DSM 4028]